MAVITTEILVPSMGHPTGDLQPATYTSDKVKANGYYGQVDGKHTVFVSLNNYVGKIAIQGTLAFEPTEDDWSTIVFSANGLTSGVNTSFEIEYPTIVSETFQGNNHATSFTLATEQTTEGCIVSINGIVQEPNSAYTITGTTLQFVEPPLMYDTIEVRKLLSSAIATVTAQTVSANTTSTLLDYPLAETSNKSYNFLGNFVWIRAVLTDWTEGNIGSIRVNY